MNILWGSEAVKPEDATPLNPKNVRASAGGDLMVVTPTNSYAGGVVKPKGTWVEVHPDKNFKSIKPLLWANSKIRKTVGVLAGFDSDLTMELVNMAISRRFQKTNMVGNIAIINGPNLNLLGDRESNIYGNLSLKEVYEECKIVAPNVNLVFRQSNSESEIVSWIQSMRHEIDCIIINAGAYTHTSIAIHDALRAYDDQIIELHISNPHQREEFRHVSYITPVAQSLVAGFGTNGYKMALLAACARL